MKLPEGFKIKYRQLLGNESNDFFETYDSESISGYRLNPLKSDPVADERYIAAKKINYATTGFFGQVNGKSLDHVSGYLYSQEPSAMYVGEVVDAHPGETVLDLCAAPGGKSTHIAGQMMNSGVLVSNEIFTKRAKILASNIERWGTTNTIVTNEDPKKLENHWGQLFDRILVDAPCSGEGMFRKDPDAMDYWTPDYSNECANRQKKILTSAMKMLKPGGTLVYSTCTFAPEENEQVIAWLLQNYPELELKPIKKYPGMDDGRPEWADDNPELAKAVRLFPHHIEGEGHFIAKLTSKTNKPMSTKTSLPKKHKNRESTGLDKEQQKLWQQFVRDTNLKLDFAHMTASGDRLYANPSTEISLNGLKVITPGVLLGFFKKNRFEPAYTLALTLDEEKIRTIDINDEEWVAYVHGDVIKKDVDSPNGWYLLTCHHHSVGFGKLVNKDIKNFFPKGLRF